MADETPGLPLLPFTRALHNLAIHIIRWRTEIELTLNIVDELHRKHIEFYDNILQFPHHEKKPQVYHRIQDHFLNCKQTLASNLLEVGELHGRVDNLINVVGIRPSLLLS